MRREHNFVIGAQTAEDLKFRVGSAHKGALTERAEIRGRNLSTGMPTTVMLHPDEVLPSLEPALEQMVAAVVETLEETPPELAADVMSHGLMLAGGGALLPGLDERLRRDTGLAVHVTDVAAHVRRGGGRPRARGGRRGRGAWRASASRADGRAA